MPQDRRRPTLSQPVWTPNGELFSLEALSTSEGVEIASVYLQTISSTSSNQTSVLSSATTYLLTLDPSVFPLVLSYDDTLNKEFSDALSSTFPTTAGEFMTSNQQQVLDHLKIFYHRLPPEEEDPETSKLDGVHLRLHRIAPALTILSQNTYNSTSNLSPEPRSPMSPSVDEDDEIPFLVKKHRKKKSRGASIVIDDSPFRGIGARMPRGLEEVERLEGDLLEELKAALKTYMKCLLQPVSRKHALNLLSVRLIPIPPSVIPGKSSPGTKFDNNPASNKGIPQSLQLFNHVQTIQLLEENVKGFGAWKILLSGECMRNLRQFRRSDRHMFDIIKKKIKELSEGFFSRDNQKRLVRKDTEVPIYEAKMTNDTRLVYTIDCIPETSGERVTQAIKVFGVYTHAQINSRLWAAVAYWSSRRGPEHRKRCVARATSKQQGGYVIPSSWPPIQETYEAPDVEADVDPEFNLELHALLTHEKFVTLTQSVLDSIIADEESTHPFCVSHREHEIIYHPSSCFVVGRSGTGKTTTMLFKMLGIERSSRKLGGAKVRQIFVTQSKVLADRVEEYFNNLIQSCAGDSQTAEELEWRAAKRKEAEKNLMELDEEDDSSSNLPLHFSQLEDKHFPLFLTFDKLCKLLEAEFTAPVDSHESSSRRLSIGNRFHPVDNSDVDFTLEDNVPPPRLKPRLFSPRDQKILYEDFRAKYWPHFPQTGTKGLGLSRLIFTELCDEFKQYPVDPALVWNEFQGVIRGSELSLKDRSGSLGRATYESLSSRTQATFSRHRSRLYDVFEVYAKLKRDRREVDSADRTHGLLQYLQDSPPLALFDYIYVDEVQDNLLIDARLIRSLCRNPHGLFWAGDTAQQITSTAFRFSDLKAFLHRLEAADPMVQTQRREAIHPKAFTLSINYRSHRGITNCAHSVVQLLTELWPDSIDTLDREQGLVDGPKPVFFTGCDTDSAHYEQFLFGNAHHRIEFGAHQCILVRNDAARKKLRQHIGDVGVIMTVYESKGLEFNDVLLYNFFEDSSIESEWRVVLNGIEPKNRAGIAVPGFNELRHTGVCSELKFLYVGLTRARNNLWIWDTSVWADPMKQFWESRGQIEIKTPGDVPRLAVSSTPEEWEKMGRILFARGNYQQAVVCFDRAELPLLRDISHSYHLRREARLLEVGSSRRKAAFFDVGNHFSKCGAGEHEQSQKCYIRAGECYAEAGNDMEASDAFCKAEEFTKGAQHARKAARFDRAVEIVRDYPVERPVAAKIIGVCQVQFLRENAFKKARSLFDSDEDFLEHFDVFGFDKAPILVEVGRFEEAADLLLQNGDAIGSIKLYLQADSDSSRTKAGGALLEEWWRCLPFGARVPAPYSPTIEALASLTSQAESLDVGHESEIGLFQAIFKNDKLGLTVYSEQLMKSGDVITALRGLFHLFGDTEDTMTFDLNQMEFHLSNLHWFGAKLRSILGMLQNEFALAIETQKLLGYRISSESLSSEAILLSSSGIIQRLLQGDNRVSGRSFHEKDTQERVIPVEEAGRIGRELLAEEFQAIIERHCVAAQKAPSFQPICKQNISGTCQSSDCMYLHISADGMKEAVNDRFRLFLHQTLVINNMDFVMLKPERRGLRRIWMSQLMDVIYPQTNDVAKLTDIQICNNQSTNDLVRHGLVVLREWVRDAFYGLNPSYTRHMLRLFLLASAVDHHGVPRYFNRVNFYLARKFIGYRYQRPLTIDLFNICFPRGVRGNGVDHLQHIIQSNMPVDIHALVCMLEMATTRLLAGLKPDLHGLVIPRSWLFSLAQHRPWSHSPNLEYLPHLLEFLISLVQNIERRADHLFVDGRPVLNAKVGKCIVLVRRILRCIVLHGCNYESNMARDMIGKRITGLRSDSAESILPTNYTRAENWQQLSYVATQSSKTDAVIQLVKRGDIRPVPTLTGVAKCIFQDTPSLFSTFMESPLADYQPRRTLNPNATVFIPQTVHRVVQEPVRETVGTNQALYTSTPEQGKPSSELREEPDVNDLFTNIHHDAARRIQIAYRRSRIRRGLFTNIHHDAARRIQLAYRRFRRRISTRPKSHALNHWFKEYSAIGKLPQCSRTYRVVVRGPLPHLLVCANAFRRSLDEQKIYASKMTHTVIHTDLEEAMDRLHQILDLRRQFLKHFHEVKPSSALHGTPNLAKLKEEVRAITSDIGPFCAERLDLKEHFELAYKGILQVKKVAATAIKPSLNTSDLYE